MGLSKEEIIDLASRYMKNKDLKDFPHERDVFFLLIRDLSENKVLAEEEGWGFGGYGLCTGYTIDEQAKPSGKWLWMHFVALDSFPPAQQVIRLQPPHVVKGRFQNPQRTREIRMVKLEIANALGPTETAPISTNLEETRADSSLEKKDDDTKIVRFRKKDSPKNA